jgi:hypothetical protein
MEIDSAVDAQMSSTLTNIPDVHPSMVEFSSIIDEAMSRTHGIKTLVRNDFLANHRNVDIIKMANDQVGMSKVTDALVQAINEIEQEFGDRNKMKWPHMLLTARFRRQLRSNGVATLPDDRVDTRASHDSSRKTWNDADKPVDLRRGRSLTPLSSRDRRRLDDWIYDYRLDSRCADLLKYTVNPRELDEIMDLGSLRGYKNPSREVMLRIKEVTAKSRTDRRRSDRSRSRSPPRRGRSRSPRRSHRY